MSLKDIVRTSNRKRGLDDEAIKDNVYKHIDKYRELIAY